MSCSVAAYAPVSASNDAGTRLMRRDTMRGTSLAVGTWVHRRDTNFPHTYGPSRLFDKRANSPKLCHYNIVHSHTEQEPSAWTV